MNKYNKYSEGNLYKKQSCHWLFIDNDRSLRRLEIILVSDNYTDIVDSYATADI